MQVQQVGATVPDMTYIMGPNSSDLHICRERILFAP